MTDARASGGDDRVHRMKQYLLAMGVRTLCFPLAIWAFVQERYVVAGILAFLAAVIPSFAVMLANAVDRRQAPATDEVRSPTRSLGPGQGPDAAAEQAHTPTSERPQVISGTILSRHHGPAHRRDDS